MHNPSISIVVPSWNSEKLLKKNLPHIYNAAKAIKAEIIVIDDASTDYSWEYLLSQGRKIKAVRNNRNIGFARSVNKGVSLSKGYVVILLNTDVRPEPECFKNALPIFTDKSVFAVSFNSGDGWAGGEWDRGLLHHYLVPAKKGISSPQVTLWASGGQAAFDRKKWEILGGFDPIFAPFYWEDTDLGYRAWKRGWKSLWEPTAKVEHQHESSVIATQKSDELIRESALRNQFLFVWKNITDSNLIFDHFLNLPRYLFLYPSAVLKALAKLPQIKRPRVSEVNDKEILSQWK